MECTINFIIDPKEIDNIFKDFKQGNPFTLKNNLKKVQKKYLFDDQELYSTLAQELQVAYKNIKRNDIIYESKKNIKIAILKFRMPGLDSKTSKRDGFRIVSLIDKENDMFYLLDIYSHSQGKDNLTDTEKNKVKKLCEEYAESL